MKYLSINIRIKTINEMWECLLNIDQQFGIDKIDVVKTGEISKIIVTHKDRGMKC